MIAQVLIVVIEWALDKLGIEVWKWFENYKSLQAIKAQAKADAKLVQDAKTPEEANAAIKKSMDDINRPST